MSLNTFGHLFRVTTFGESHGPALGAIVDGCPPGLALTEADLQRDLDRRRPGQSRYTTQRDEPGGMGVEVGVDRRRPPINGVGDGAGTGFVHGLPTRPVVGELGDQEVDEPFGFERQVGIEELQCHALRSRGGCVVAGKRHHARGDAGIARLSPAQAETWITSRTSG